MKLFLKILLALFIVINIVVQQSCFKLEKYPPEPKIEFVKFSFKDSIGFNHLLAGELIFSFVDGDGDIGFGIDTNNVKTVFIEKYKIINNRSIRVELDENMLSYQIPRFSTSGNRKPLKGEIIIRNLDEIPPINPNDTIMYKFYIVDRSLKYSNVDSTGYLILGNFIN